MHQRYSLITLGFVLVLCNTCLGQEESDSRETLRPLHGTKAPDTHESLWAEFDPRAEPLEVEVLHAWEEDGIALQVLHYRIGVFKGQKATMAAVYGRPKNGKNLPGLVQIHGGGQYADYRAPLANAKRGYATISISWAGRINAPDYLVTPEVVQLFWDNQTDSPAYRLTTDWGALDGYHSPTRSGGGGFGGTKPSKWTLDEVESPRNSPWFLCTIGARRALTFLEQQPEVDRKHLGVYGHSMGGRLTVLTAGSDSRVKAAVPSCGGISLLSNGESPNGDDVALSKISCPILFQSPSNDFHGRIGDLKFATDSIQSTEWRVTCSPHHNHQDSEAFEVASQLWFDEHLKERFAFPASPLLNVELDTEDGIPFATVVADDSMPIKRVDFYYTRHGLENETARNMKDTISRFWHHAKAKPSDKNKGLSSSQLPLSNVEQPLWVYANVLYELSNSVGYAGYYYRIGSSNEFNLSSTMFTASSDDLKAAGTKATLDTLLSIEDFEDDWEREWFTYRPTQWGRRTDKLRDDLWKAPHKAKLAFEVKASQANKLVVGIDNFAAEVQLVGHGIWQSVVLSLTDFQDAEAAPLSSWEGIRELRLLASDFLERKKKLGGAWQGLKPEFRNLRWIP